MSRDDIAGIVGALAGGQPPVREHRAGARVTHPQHSSSTYRYCASFAVTGSNLEQWRFAPVLACFAADTATTLSSSPLSSPEPSPT